MDEKIYDLIIVGAGPAGLTAAIYALRAGLHTLLLEKNFVSGGQTASTYEVDNYPGLPGISGESERKGNPCGGRRYKSNKNQKERLSGEDGTLSRGSASPSAGGKGRRETVRDGHILLCYL